MKEVTGGFKEGEPGAEGLDNMADMLGGLLKSLTDELGSEGVSIFYILSQMVKKLKTPLATCSKT